MKKTCFLIFTLLLAGCGSNTPTTEQIIQNGVGAFSVPLPEGWEMATDITDDSIATMAKSGTESLVGTYVPTYRTADELLKQAAVEMYFVELKEPVSSTIYAYSAKRRVQSALRDYTFRIVAYEPTRNILFTCASIPNDPNAVCDDILESIEIR